MNEVARCSSSPSHVDYIVAVTSWGDSVCKSTNNNYRVDLESSRSFIDDMNAQNP